MADGISRLLPAGPRPGFRACVGALLGLFLTGLICREWLGGTQGLPFLAGPMGSSAVLLFALPSSPLARPWNVIGGNMISALVGVAVVSVVSDPLTAAALAVALAIAAMSLARCIHPPGGAVALLVVLGGPAVAEAGWSIALTPIGLNSAVLVALAWAFNHAVKVEEPEKPHGPATFIPALDKALARRDELLDVSREDLDSLFLEVEAEALADIGPEMPAREIMDQESPVARPDAAVADVIALLRSHRLPAIPVVDDQRNLLGMATHIGLLQSGAEKVSDAMESPPPTIGPDQPIEALLPILAAGHPMAMVIHADGRLMGIITQATLLHAMWNSLEKLKPHPLASAE